MFYVAAQYTRGQSTFGPALLGNGWKWKWALGLLNVGVLGMTVALLISGYEQSFILLTTQLPLDFPYTFEGQRRYALVGLEPMRSQIREKPCF